MGPLQQVPLLAWCLLVGLPLWGIVVRRRRNISGPSRVKAPDYYTSEASGVEAPVQEVNDSLDRLGKQSDVPTIQILFFHGLPLEEVSNVHFETWDRGDGFIWPQAWLVEEFPGAHIFFVKYDVALKNANFNMNNIGENLISDLLQANIGQVRGCPVVLVGHCIGGLVIKQLCWKAHELHSVETSRIDRAEMLAAFLDNLKGIFYYSTPHVGIREITKATHLCRSPLFKFFETLSTRAAVLNSNFDHLRKRYFKWKIEGVGESLDVQLGVFKNTLVVKEASSRVGVDHFHLLKEDHFSISKPKGKTSGGYYHLTSLLSNIAKEEIRLQKERLQHEMMLQAERLPQNMQPVSKYLVGMETGLQEIRSRLESVATLGLTGMGGLGKTTLAKALFNELGNNFEYSCFVPDVKLISGSVETLKKEVWKYMYRNGKEVGKDEQWSDLREKSVLLVLDDVSRERDVKPFLEIAESFSVQSRLIATSREKDVFNPFDDVYEVALLDETSAQQLFTSYAFQDKEIPPPKLASLMTQIVEKCERLPLTLEVIGQFLKKKRNEEDWEQTLAALDEAKHVQNFNERIWIKLRPSIEGLEENEKQVFLDATSFFCSHQWRLREALAAWREAYVVGERLLWQTLVDRSLVYDVGEDEYIKVHEQLRSLGRKIANECNIGNIHIFKLEDIKLLQSTNELDRKNIHALRIKLDQTDGEENHPRQSTADDRDSNQISSVDGKIHVASLALQQLKELRYLEIHNQGEIDGAAEAILFPSRLVLLRCVGLKTFNLTHQRRLAILDISGVEFLPSSLGQLSALRIFNLRYASLKSIPEEIGDLSKLEVLKIWSCVSLQSLPEKLGELSKLKILGLCVCQDLLTLPESFGKLSSLEHLYLSRCGVETLPESFGDLAALVQLKFHRCKSLKCLPQTFGQLSALRRLHFSDCNRLRSLPESFGELSALNYLCLDSCNNLESLPESFGLLGALVDLKFIDCLNLECLPKTFGHLSALSRLEFSEVGLRSLPESFGKLSALNYLQFNDCGGLGSLPESFGLLGALVDLKFEGCLNLECLPKTFGHLSALSRLEFIWCSRLRSLPESIGNLPVLRHLKLSSTYVLHHLPESLGQLAKLEYLEIDDLEELKRLPDSVAELGSLRHLIITDLFSLKSIPDYIRNLPSLHTLELGELPHVKDLPPWLGETGVNCLGLPRKVFRIQDRHFSLTRDETVVKTFKPIKLVSKIQCRAMGKVRTSDYEGALAELEVSSLGVPKLDGFLLQDKGIIKRKMGDLDGALDDLSAALECFSKADDGHHYSYDCWKHRGYVNFLKGRMEDAENDGTMALKLQLTYRGCVLSGYPEFDIEQDEYILIQSLIMNRTYAEDENTENVEDARVDGSLGEICVRYMHFRLEGREGTQEMEQHEVLLSSLHSEVMQKVKASNFQGALASFDVINVLLLRKDHRGFFLQERGVLKRLAGDLGGALEDLTAASEMSQQFDYECMKHLGYVEYLLGDLDGARFHAEMSLRLGYRLPRKEHLATAAVAFMEFNLK